MCWGGKSKGLWQEIKVDKEFKVRVDTSLKDSKKPTFFVIPLNQVQHHGGQTYKYINRLEMPQGQIAPFDQAPAGVCAWHPSEKNVGVFVVLFLEISRYTSWIECRVEWMF